MTKISGDTSAPFSYSLNLQNEGSYYFLVDALRVSTNDYVWQHEVSHRVFGYLDAPGNGWDIIRAMASTSHLAVDAILYLMQKYNIQVRGQPENWADVIRFIEFLKENGRVTATDNIGIDTFLEGLIFFDSIEYDFDNLWPWLNLISEMAAIDFSDRVMGESTDWNLDSPPSRVITESSYDKDDLFKNALRSLVDDRGNSFFFNQLQILYGERGEEVIWQAWIKYRNIKNDRVRKELLLLCTYSLLGTENNEKFNNPIDTIRHFSELTKVYGVRTLEIIVKERERLSVYGKQAVDRFSFKKKPSRFSSETFDANHYVYLLHELVKQQAIKGTTDYAKTSSEIEQLKHILLGFSVMEDLTKPNGSEFWMLFDLDGLGAAMTVAEYSLLRFIDNPDRVVIVNPLFIGPVLPGSGNFFAAIADDSIEVNWWRILLFYEKLRYSLKTGQQFRCPLRGYHIYSPVLSDMAAVMESDGAAKPRWAVECGPTCPIRKKIRFLRAHWPGIVSPDAACTIGGSPPKWLEAMTRPPKLDSRPQPERRNLWVVQRNGSIEFSKPVIYNQIDIELMGEDQSEEDAVCSDDGGH